MIPFWIYKVLHLGGVLMVFLAIGSAVTRTATGSSDRTWRRTAGITHGIGLILVLTGGFGMMARLGITDGWPGWIYAKVAIWVALGGIIALLGRRAGTAPAVWYVSLGLGMLAAYFAISKPF